MGSLFQSWVFGVWAENSVADGFGCELDGIGEYVLCFPQIDATR